MLEQIIEKSKELTFPEFLRWLVTSKVLIKVGSDQLKKVYEIIRNKHNEGKYVFVPNKEEVYTLKKLSGKSLYKDFKKLLRNHWGVDVVRTGIYINILEQQKQVEKIKEIKEQIFKNKKLPVLRLVEMVNEGILRAVLDHLKDLKDKHNYSQEDINNEFEGLLHRWKKITIFVKNEDFVENVVKSVKGMIDKKEETLFIFAKGNAINIACSALVKLQADQYLLEKGYIWFAETNEDTVPPSYYCGIHCSTYLL